MNIKDILEDKEFQKLSDSDKAQVINYVLQKDPDFLQLPSEEKGKVRQFLIQKISPSLTTSTLKQLPSAIKETYKPVIEPAKEHLQRFITTTKEQFKELPQVLKQETKETIEAYKKVPRVLSGLTFRLPAEISTFAQELYESPATPHPVKEALIRTIERIKKGQLITPEQYLEKVYIKPEELTPKQAFFTTLGTELLGYSSDILLNPFWHPKSLQIIGQAIKTTTAPIINKLLYNTTLERLTKEVVKEIEAGIREAPDWYKTLNRDDRAKLIKELFEKGEAVVPVKKPKPFVVKLESILNTPWGKGWWERVKARWQTENIPEQIQKEIKGVLLERLPEPEKKVITTPAPEEVRPPIAVEPVKPQKISPEFKSLLEEARKLNIPVKIVSPAEYKKLGMRAVATFRGEGLRGTIYIPSTIKRRTSDVEAVFYHEMGHALQYNYPEFKEALQKAIKDLGSEKRAEILGENYRYGDVMQMAGAYNEAAAQAFAIFKINPSKLPTKIRTIIQDFYNQIIQETKKVKPEIPPEFKPLAEKLPRAEEFAKKMGIEIKRTKSGTGIDIRLETDLKTGKATLKIPEKLDINSPETQFYIWHEIGHYLDQARFYGGKGQMTSQIRRNDLTRF